MTSVLERPAPVTSPPPKRRRALRLPGPWTYAALIAVLAGSAFPVYWSLVVSSQTPDKVTSVPPVLVPGGHLFANISRVFDRTDFALAMMNSLIVSGTITVSVVFFSTLAGFAFAKLKFRGRSALMLLVVATQAVPTELGVIPLYMMMSELGWASEIHAVIVPGLVTAFGVFYMRQFISSAVPDELIEAARMDGASTVRVYWTVVVPAIRPAMAVLGLLAFVGSWNDFQWPLITLGGTDQPTSMVALSDLASGNYVKYRRVLAGAFLATVPLIIMLFIGGRQIVRGIMEGAVKS